MQLVWLYLNAICAGGGKPDDLTTWVIFSILHCAPGEGGGVEIIRINAQAECEVVN